MDDLTWVRTLPIATSLALVSTWKGIVSQVVTNTGAYYQCSFKGIKSSLLFLALSSKGLYSKEVSKVGKQYGQYER